jgi:seryl-tRNA synthetase
MIFPAMMFVLGFVCAALVAWLIMPPLVRSLTRNNRRWRRVPRDIRAALADKDRLRAEFALSLRKSERNIEKLKSRAHDQLIELAERNAQIGILRKEMSRMLDPIEHPVQDKAPRAGAASRTESVPTSPVPKPEREVKDREVKDNVHSLEPREVDLSKISDPAPMAKKTEPVLKGSLANRIHKLKSPE